MRLLLVEDDVMVARDVRCRRQGAVTVTLVFTA
jgi:hypothetical protein